MIRNLSGAVLLAGLLIACESPSAFALGEQTQKIINQCRADVAAGMTFGPGDPFEKCLFARKAFQNDKSDDSSFTPEAAARIQGTRMGGNAVSASSQLISGIMPYAVTTEKSGAEKDNASYGYVGGARTGAEDPKDSGATAPYPLQYGVPQNPSSAGPQIYIQSGKDGSGAKPVYLPY